MNYQLSKNNRKRFLVCFILVFFYSLVCKFCQGSENQNDFILKVDGHEFNVVVGQPITKQNKHPLVIYHHGEGYWAYNPFELRKLAQLFANEGILFWAPEIKSWTPVSQPDFLQEISAVNKAILALAMKSQDVDQKDINVVGLGMSSWVVFENDVTSTNIRTISLLGFGIPYYIFSDYVKGLIDHTDYNSITAKLLLMVNDEDLNIDIESAEVLRKKLISAGKKVDCMEYPDGGHMSLTGTNHYTKDLINFLKGERIDTTNSIKVDKDLKKKLKRIRETGYW